MKLIVGLGNPGPQYEKTRHNVGFMVVDHLVGNGTWEHKAKFNADIFKLRNDVILAKPQTFMNLSGKTVVALAEFYLKKTSDIWIIHDDIDLPLGTLRIRQNGGSGGHKGIESITTGLGSEDFVRFRVGIRNAALEQMKERNKDAYQAYIEHFVLSKFGKEEESAVHDIIQQTAKSILYTLDYGIDKAMNKFNGEV